MNNEVIRLRITKLLEMYPYLEARAYSNADTNAIDTIIDLDYAINRADLDETDLFVLQKVYFEDYTQIELEGKYNISRDVIRYRSMKLLSRIGHAYYFPFLY